MVRVKDESTPRVSYNQQYRRCGRLGCPSCSEGKLGHGPYWYAHWREGGHVRTRYLGKQPPEDLQAVALDAGTPSGPDPAEVTIPPSRDAGVLSTASPDRPVVPGTPGTPVVAIPMLRVRTLGMFEVWRGEARVPSQAWNQKVGAAFKCLVSAPGHQLSRESLIDVLWPEADAAAGARNLSSTLHRLRRVLGDAAPGKGYIRVEGDLLVLRPTGPAGPLDDWLDADTFDRAARHALSATDPVVCRAALALYTGDYLPGDAYEDWALARRESLRLRYLDLALHLADLAGARGETLQAEQSLRTVLALDLCHEEAAGRLMGLLAAAGRRTDAMRIYHDLAAALMRELDATPSQDLATLQAQLLAREATPTAAAQPPRLPDAPRRTNLPRALTSFVGRAREQDEIRQLLAETRLLTLTGAGGCGKTRLALQVADMLVESYADGVWLVELAALPPSARDRTLITAALAGSLGVQEQPGESLDKTLAAFLAPRHLLLVLDNCEHVRAPCVALVAALLTACPQLGVLATSREQLGVPGELLFGVPSLAVPPLDVQPEAQPRYEAAALFLARARVCRSG